MQLIYPECIMVTDYSVTSNNINDGYAYTDDITLTCRPMPRDLAYLSKPAEVIHSSPYEVYIRYDKVYQYIYKSNTSDSDIAALSARIKELEEEVSTMRNIMDIE